jgi:hypothetical protein
LSMDSESNSKREWSPSIITFYDETELDLSEPVKAKKLVENNVSSKLLDALTVQYPDTVFEGIFTPKNSSRNDTIFVISGSICDSAFKFGRLDKINYKMIDNFERIKPTLKEDTSQIGNGCIGIFNSKVTGKVNGKIAVVSEMNRYSPNTFFINTVGTNLADAYIIYPDRSTYLIAGERRKHYSNYPYPMVAGNGNEFLLDSNQKSSVNMID